MDSQEKPKDEKTEQMDNYLNFLSQTNTKTNKVLAPPKNSSRTKKEVNYNFF